MILYHGSNVAIEKIDLSLSRPYKDFGRGFYLSDNFEQAERMGEFKVELYGGSPIVTKFEFDEARLSDGTLKCLRFESYSNEWAEFVFKNRAIGGIPFSHDYDVVTGPIANDKVGAQIRRYMERDITLEVFLERIKFMRGITIQYFFGTEKAVALLRKAE